MARDGQMGQTPEESPLQEKTGMVERALGGSARKFSWSYPFFVVLVYHPSLIFLSCTTGILVALLSSSPYCEDLMR